MNPLPPRTPPLGRARGSSFGEHAPVLAADGGAMVYVALAPRTVAQRLQGGSTRFELRSGARARSVSICEVAVVRGLLSWARRRMNLSAVDVLQLPHAVIVPERAATMAWQLQRASEICDGTRLGGVGIWARDSSGFVRGFPCPDAPVLLAAVNDGALWASSGALILDCRDRHAEIVGWRVTADHVCASTPIGEIDVTGTSAEQLLRRLAPGLDDVVVREVSLRSTFAGLFVSAIASAREAATTGVSLLAWHDAGHRG
jgi:hypothetical protein